MATTTFARGSAHKFHSIFSKPISIRKNSTKGGSSYGETLRELMKMEAAVEVNKNSMVAGGNYDDGSCWLPHDRTGIYYPKGQEKVLADLPAEAGKDITDGINWFF